MKTKRIKKPAFVVTSRAEAEASMHTLAININIQRKLRAQIDQETLEIIKPYESALWACELAINAHSAALQTWAESHPGEFPKDRKSLDLVSGVIGFRTGTPKLALLSRAWNWEKVLASLDRFAVWVRTKREVDKEVILADFSLKKTDAEQLARHGVKVVQEESFFVEPKLADMTARQTSEAA